MTLAAIDGCFGQFSHFFCLSKLIGVITYLDSFFQFISLAGLRQNPLL